MLTDQRRKQLDGIVGKMVANKEKDTSIQFVVDDFKKKYEHEAEIPTEPKKGFLGTKSGDSTYGKVIDNSITRGIQRFLPGKQIGEGLSDSFSGINALIHGDKQGYEEATNRIDQNAPKIFGDAVNAGLTAASPAIGGGTTSGARAVGGRILQNTALGAGLGGSKIVSEGGGVSDTVKGAAVGGAIGGATSAVGEGLSVLSKKLPVWFAKSALPKSTDESASYALQNSSIGSTKTLLAKSRGAASNYGDQIQTILKHPEYADETGKVTSIVEGVGNKFPESGMDGDKIVKIVKNVAKGNAKIVEKVANGTATLAEQNTLRQELDQAVYPKFTDTPSLTFNKKVAKAFTDLLRSNVQTTAPETQPIFNKFSKEITFMKALQAIDKKNNLKPTFTDLAALYGGYQIGGVKGAVQAVAAERLLGSNAARLAGGKALQSGAKYAVPAATALTKGLKAPLISQGVSSFVKPKPSPLKPVSALNKSSVSVVIPPTSRLSHVNNNPGNLRFAGQAGAVKGEKGFAKFSTPEAGFKALKNQIKIDATRGLTLAKFISKFAPPTENNTKLYIKQLAGVLHASANTSLAELDHDQLARAVAQKESGTKIK